MDKAQKHLEELGLSPNEAKVYLASLELGPATAQQLAGKAAVVRPTAYVAIGGLVKRGLMSQFTKGKKVNFQAEKPEQLAHLLEIEKRDIAEREAKLKDALPMLRSLISLSGDKPEVKYYEGMEGLDALHEVLFSSKAKEISVILSTQYDTVVPLSWQEGYNTRFGKAGIKGRAIKFSPNPKRQFDIFSHTKVGSSEWEIKYIFSEKPEEFGEISAFGNYLVLIVYSDKPYGFVLKSKAVVNTFKAAFEGFWKSLKVK